MTMLAQYDRARAALAEAVRIDQVLPLRDEIAHIKLYAAQIRDRALMAAAAEFQLRVERRLGVLLAAAKDAGQIVAGRPRARSRAAENGSDDEPFPRVTLAEAGVDKKLSMTAQKAASISEPAFEAMVAATRERVIAGRARIIDNGPIHGARAVMGSRAEPADSLDYFPTPPWATRALLDTVLRQLGRRGDLHRQTAWEPACGEGHIAEVLAERFAQVAATDIHDYGYADYILDFLDPAAPAIDADWIITNPPFGDKSEAFTLKALRLARVGVAMFVRLQWLETIGRYETIFRDTPPTLIAFFAERVPLCKGRWDPDGDTATAYVWLVWVRGSAPRAPFWIPPGCRERLTRPDDAARFTARPVIKLLRAAATEGGGSDHAEDRRFEVGERAESQAKATEGKAGMAGVTDPVRRSTAGTGLRVGEAGADQPATSEFMDATAGETASNSEASSHEKRRLDASGEQTSTGPETSTSPVRMIAQCSASTALANRDATAGRDRQPFPIPAPDGLDIPAFLRRGPDNSFPDSEAN